MIHRCEAGPNIGTGHFFRQLALAEEAKARGRNPVLLVSGLTTELAQQAEAAGVEVIEAERPAGSEADARAVTRRAAEAGSRSVVVDGYRFGPNYYRWLGETFDVVVAVDDLGKHSFPVDVLVNVNPHASELSYEGPRQSLLGPQYALLRRQFVEARRRIEQEYVPPVPEEVGRVLVAFGGGDPGELNLKALAALEFANYQGEIDLVLGPTTVKNNLSERIPEGSEIRVHRNVLRMADIMQDQHLALCAAGGTSWELACLGVPMIQTVVADNQHPIAVALEDRGVALRAGCSEIEPSTLARLFRRVANDRALRVRMIRRGMQLVDGQGAQRVLDVISNLRGDPESIESSDLEDLGHQR